MNFDESQTKLNLARSFAGECMDGARYQIIAQKAMQEGKQNIQSFFKSIAKNEMSHAKTFWNLIASNTSVPQHNIEIKAGYPFADGKLKDMIKYATNTEKSESTSIYPSFAKIAEDEGFKDIAQKFKLVAMAESEHFLQIDSLYNKLKSGDLYLTPTPYDWKCDNCGYTQNSKEAFETCPLCEMPRDNINLSIITCPRD